MKKQIKYLEDVKLRNIFYIFAGLWAIDLLSTFIALNFFDNFSEANPLQAQLFNLGWYGWFVSIFFTLTILFILTLVIGFGGIFLKRLEKKKKVKGYYNIYLFYCCGIFSGFEVVVLINNIGLLLQMI